MTLLRLDMACFKKESWLDTDLDSFFHQRQANDFNEEHIHSQCSEAKKVYGKES